jgi:hypothetical protein
LPFWSRRAADRLRESRAHSCLLSRKSEELRLMIQELVTKVFATRNAVHTGHWKTKSYAEHMALGDFYDGLVDKIDAIVEMYQGAFGLIDSIDSEPVVGKDIVRHLTDEAKWINDNRETISGDWCAIENALDDLVGLYLTTLYKLKNLS